MSFRERLRRLREMPLDEIAHRLGRSAAVLRDRAEVSLGVAGPRSCRQVLDPQRLPDGEARAALAASDDTSLAAALARYFRTRTAPQFYFSRSDRQQLLAEHGRLFPGRIDQLRQEAECVCAHEFRIFGYPAVHCGPEIPWRRDLVHGQESGLEHYSRVPYLDFAKTGDSKTVWEPNRHQHFITLGQAYFLGGDERYAHEFVAQWRHWRAANPYHRGINWASSLESAFRLWSWIWAFQLMLDSEEAAALVPEFLAGLHEHAEHILANLSTYFSPNTHLLGEGFALFVAGLMFPEMRRAGVWHETGRAIVAAEIARQVFPDGVHREQSSYYHRYALEFFVCAAVLGEKNGRPFPSEYRERLNRMADALAFGSFPGGRDRMAGDADGGRLLPFAPFDANDVRPGLALAGAYLSRPDLCSLAEKYDESAFWVLGDAPATQFSGSDVRTPAEASRVFPDSGLVTMRSGWDANARVLFFDAGPQGLLGCGHGHADALSICCAADGRQWLVDPGTYVYTASEMDRHRFRSTRAHNTVVVDGEDQAAPVAAFKWRNIPRVELERAVCLSSLDVATASHSGYARLSPPVTHRRTVVFVKPDYWLVRDELGGTGVHELEFLFHFAPDCVPNITEHGCAVSGHGKFALLGTDATVEWASAGVQERDPRVAWYSRDYGQREAAPVVVARKRTALPFVCSWLLYTGAVEGLRFASEGPDIITVHSGPGEDRLCFGQGAHGDAEFAFVRRSGSAAVQRLVVVNGSRLSGDGYLLEAEERLLQLEVMREAGGAWHVSRKPECAVRLVLNEETVTLSRGRDVPTYCEVLETP